MGAYVVRRLFFSLFVLWGAVTIIFVVLRLVPGDPAYIMLGPDADQAQVDALRAQLGLDHSLIQQYATYLANVVHLDFGQSFRLNADSMSLVLQRVPATIQLASTALLLSLLIGLPLGVIAALRANSWVDRSISVFSLMGQSTPSFWLGIVLILVFARGLQVLPSAGSGTWSHLVLPTITLALPFLAILVRLTAQRSARGRARGLRADGPGERARRGDRDPRPRAAERADPDRHRGRPAVRCPARRHRDRRDRVRLAGRRPAADRLDRPPRLRRRPGVDLAGRQPSSSSSICSWTCSTASWTRGSAWLVTDSWRST